jgi:hypothetical protein
VADLLECLIQIKGVADTPRRLDVRLSVAAWSAGTEADAGRRMRVVGRMAAAEECFARCLTLMLSRDRAMLPALPTFVADDGTAGAATVNPGWPEEFTTRRAQTVAVLERCSADQLNRVGLEPSRGPMTVADLVATMLAHDTDCLGAIQPR